jgi:glycosyltransferase involved in cell wall biosynthesis
LVLTKYYPHKNIEILVETAKQIKANGDKVKILITISKEQYPNVGDLLNEIEKANVSDVMINIGPVNIFEIPSLYRSVDGLLLPTVLESFSATYVDAMYFEVPIFTSNLDFAQEICGDVAFYFDPHNSNDIYSTIVNNLFDENKIKEKIALGKIRISQFPDWTKVAFEYINQLKLLKWKK